MSPSLGKHSGRVAEWLNAADLKSFRHVLKVIIGLQVIAWATIYKSPFSPKNEKSLPEEINLPRELWGNVGKILD